MALGMLNVKQDNMPVILVNFGILWKVRDDKLSTWNYPNVIGIVLVKEEKNITSLWTLFEENNGVLKHAKDCKWPLIVFFSHTTHLNEGTAGLHHCLAVYDFTKHVIVLCKDSADCGRKSIDAWIVGTKVIETAGKGEEMDKKQLSKWMGGKKIPTIKANGEKTRPSHQTKLKVEKVWSVMF